jgi:HSP20 family molecular chaperone IbpA
MAPVGPEPAKLAFWPDIDVKENGKEYLFKADLPGRAARGA